MDDAGALLQPSSPCLRGHRSLADAVLRVEGTQGLRDQLALELGTGGGSGTQEVGVAVDGEARQTVGFGGAGR